MSSDHQLEPESEQKIGYPVGAEHVRHVPANVFAPALDRTNGRIGPQQVAQDTAPGHFGGPPDPVDLAHVMEIRAKATVRAEYNATYDRCHWHTVERPVERSPEPRTRK